MNVTLTRTINVPANQVYYALTNAQAVQEWLSSDARLNPSEKGRLYLWMQDGYAIVGTVRELVKDKIVAFNWRGTYDPGPSVVRIELTEADGATTVTLNHIIEGEGEAWELVAAQAKRGWKNSLENLQSVLEDGVDLRTAQQPILGVTGANPVGATQAEELGIAEGAGLQIHDPVPGMGAEPAGLQANDIIVQLAGAPVRDYPTTQVALQNHKAGDEVEVIYYRDGDKHTTTMTLSARPQPQVPDTGAELSAAVATIYAQLFDDLEALFDGVTEVEASHRPTDSEWSAKEVIAHLIYTERWAQTMLTTMQNGSPPPGFANDFALIGAMADTYGDYHNLLAQYRREGAVSVAALANLPDSFMQRKLSYSNLAANFLLGMPYHTRGHFDQIIAAIKTAREALVPA